MTKKNKFEDATFGPVRLSYSALAEKRGFQDKDPSYYATALFEEDVFKALQKKFLTFVNEVTGGNFTDKDCKFDEKRAVLEIGDYQTKIRSTTHSRLDLKGKTQPPYGEKNPEAKPYPYYIEVHSDSRPQVIDRQGKLIVKADEKAKFEAELSAEELKQKNLSALTSEAVYGGAWVKLHVTMATNYQGGKLDGFTAYLKSVLKWEDGDKFGGGQDAKDAFADDISDDADVGAESDAEISANI